MTQNFNCRIFSPDLTGTDPLCVVFHRSSFRNFTKSLELQGKFQTSIFFDDCSNQGHALSGEAIMEIRACT